MSVTEILASGPAGRPHKRPRLPRSGRILVAAVSALVLLTGVTVAGWTLAGPATDPAIPPAGPAGAALPGYQTGGSVYGQQVPDPQASTPPLYLLARDSHAKPAGCG